MHSFLDTYVKIAAVAYYLIAQYGNVHRHCIELATQMDISGGCHEQIDSYINIK